MTKDMTTGSPAKLIIGFAIPMFLGMLFQQFYSMVDTIIVGKYLGVNPLAGVGSTSSLNFMVIGFCTGVCNGFAIPVAQMFGAKEESNLRRYVTNSTWLCIGFSVVLTIVVAALCKPILILMNTPDEIFEYAYVYILIIFLGIPCTFLYNILAGIIRSLGDSKTPVVFLAISSILNVALDILFILVLHMSVEGPAWATVISQGVSGVICLFYMKKKFPILKATKEEWKPDKKYMWKLCYVGIPMGLQYSVTAIGTVIVQSAINGLGAVVVAGVTAAQKINGFIACPIESLGQTMASYVGQNIGARKLERIGKGMKSACIIGAIMSVLCFGIAFFAGRNLSLLFLDAAETEIIEYSYVFLLYCTANYVLLTLVNVIRFTIQGMGFSVFAICAGVMELFARAIAGWFLVPILGYTGICLAHPLAWVFADCFLIPAYFYCRKKLYKQQMA